MNKAAPKKEERKTVSRKPPESSVRRKKTLRDKAAAGFPIAGIGASAGGLDAFRKFFEQMPGDSGMAFVLIQHLDPNHKSILNDLIARFTAMPTFEVKHGMRVEPNCVYVIPPNRDLAILHGALQLIETAGPRYLRLSVDYFFRSLAQDQGERAVGVVLSGTGTDGALGLRAIKGEGGVALVQQPETAEYDGMPKSAIATGVADAILPPGDMGRLLLSYVRHGILPAPGASIAEPPKAMDERSRLFVLLRSQTGHDFSLYKEGTIGRRILRRMAFNQIDSETDYVRYLQQTPAELDALWREFLIRVTQFFRNPKAYDQLRDKVIPALFAGRRTIRCGSGCPPAPPARRPIPSPCWCGNTWTPSGRATRCRSSPRISTWRPWRSPARAPIPRALRPTSPRRVCGAFFTRRATGSMLGRICAACWCSPGITSARTRRSPAWTSSVAATC